MAGAERPRPEGGVREPQRRAAGVAEALVGLAGVGERLGAIRTAVLVGYGAALAAHVALGYVRGGGRSRLVDAGESVLLAAYFAVVPMLVAVGFYFPFWYSARQVARAATVEAEPVGDDEWDLVGGDSVSAAALRAWGLMAVGALATFTVVAALYWALPNPFAGSGLLPGAVAFWSVAISIVALPHVVVGELLDADRGIWYVP